MTESGPKQVTIPSNILFQVLEGETVLLNLDTETYYSLDEVGTRMWHLLEEHGNYDAVVAQMLDEYDVKAPQLRSDLKSLVESLSNEGLVLKE